MKSSTAQKIVAVVAGLAIALTFAVVATSANAQTAGASCSFVFAKNLSLGVRGADVMNLQKVLNMSADTQVAATGAGSPGNESSYFGGLTKAAVIKFQNKYASDVLAPAGLTSGTGFVGALTRAKLNAICSGGVVITPGTTTGPLSVSVGAANTYGALVSPSAAAELGKFVFSGNSQVNSVQLQRTGVSSDATLTNVYLYDGAVRLTDAASVSTGGYINFNSPSGLFTVSGSRTITVRADIATSHGGETVGVKLVSYTTAGGSAVAVNLGGATQNIATNSSAATVTVGTQTVAAQSVNAGATNFTVWSAPVNVGTRAVYLNAINFKFIGSAPTNAISNIRLLVDGAVIGPVGMINANGYVTFDLSGAPLTLNTGSHTVSVNADIVAGAYRNFQFSLQNASDLLVADSQLQGVFVAPTAVSSSVFTTNNGGLITINQGSITVQVDPAFNTTTVTGGATNVPIAQFKLTSYGEDVKVNSLVVEPQINSADTSLNNVALYVNGGQVGSTQNDATSTGLTFGTNNLFTIPAGQTVVLTVKADTISAQNTNYSTGSLTVILKTGSSNAQGVQSSQLLNVPTGNVTSNALTIGSGSATVAANSALGSFTTSANVNNVKIGSYTIQASSAEGLRVNNVAIALSGSLTPSTGLANLKVVTPAGSTNPVAPQATNSFSTSFTIPANGTAVVDVYADILGTTGTTSSSITITGQGTISNSTVAPAAVAGQTVTVGTPEMLAPTLVSTSPAAQYVVSGTNGNNSFAVATYNFVSTTSPATIQELHFAVTGTTGNISSISVTGPGQSTPVSAPVVSGTATVTGLNIVIPTGYAGGNVVVTPAYNPVGLNGLASGATSIVTLNYVKAQVGTTVITPTTSVAARTMTLVASKPTITLQSPGTSLIGGTVKLARITVSADAAGPINVDQIPLSITSNSSGAALASQILVIKDTNGTAVTGATSTAVAVTAGNSGTSNITFGASGYRIEAGQSMTFDIYGTVSGSLGNAGTSNIVTSLGTASSFTWTDVNGASSEGGLAGTLLTSYPTNTATVSN